ncbi:MAG: exodeoxyribonuclease VII large subunit [Bacteroidota bacterium]|nr:exodeoxyribonuclease VII large subunit [Bacteroidota bacterium]
MEQLSVSELTSYIKELLEDDPILLNVTVTGEISQFSIHSNGHAYFSVKDETALINCVRFKNRYPNAPVLERFDAGDKVAMTGSLTVYPPKGSYQFKANTVVRQGLGDIFKDFILLKEKLEKKGLFDQKFKQSIQHILRCFGVVTAPTGAVIHDIHNTIQRRFPAMHIVLYPSLVQGEAAVDSLIKGIDALELNKEVQAILLARGGGSLEDLWCFNSERLARRIFACKKPIISAVGHESDFTICDLVADYRMATPTAAAEFLSPDINAIKSFIAIQTHEIDKIVQRKWQEYDLAIGNFKEQLSRSVRYKFQSVQSELKVLTSQLEVHNPNIPLKKGYNITLINGKTVRDVGTLNLGDEITTIYQSGKTKSLISEITKK